MPERRPLRRGPALAAVVLVAAAAAGRPAEATRFLFDPGPARLVCENGEERALGRRGHRLIIPADVAGRSGCTVFIDYRIRAGVAPAGLDRQWASRGFVELMSLRDGVPGEPRRLYFRDHPEGVGFTPLADGAGYRVHFALDRLFEQAHGGRIWTLIGVRLDAGDRVRAFYSVSQTLSWEAVQTRAVAGEGD